MPLCDSGDFFFYDRVRRFWTVLDRKENQDVWTQHDLIKNHVSDLYFIMHMEEDCWDHQLMLDAKDYSHEELEELNKKLLGLVRDIESRD